MSNINIRINDIEFRNYEGTKGEFICWSPNLQYGKLEEYLENPDLKKLMYLKGTIANGNMIYIKLFLKDGNIIGKI